MKNIIKNKNLLLSNSPKGQEFETSPNKCTSSARFITSAFAPVKSEISTSLSSCSTSCSSQAVSAPAPLSAAQEEIFTTPLTAREQETLELIAKGYSNTQIANLMSISITTVKTHLINIYQKFIGRLSDNTTEYTVMRVRLVLEYLRIKGMLNPIGVEKCLKALQKIKTLSKAINDSDDLLLWEVYQINEQILDTAREVLNEEA